VVLPTVLDLVTEVKRTVLWRQPRPELGCRAKGKKLKWKEGILQDIRTLDIKNWRDMAVRRVEWQRLLWKAKVHPELSSH
jgi:hypothetical protein